jgi:hypothetical protein
VSILYSDKRCLAQAKKPRASKNKPNTRRNSGYTETIPGARSRKFTDARSLPTVDLGEAIAATIAAADLEDATAYALDVIYAPRKRPFLFETAPGSKKGFYPVSPDSVFHWVTEDAWHQAMIFFHCHSPMAREIVRKAVDARVEAMNRVRATPASFWPFPTEETRFSCSYWDCDGNGDVALVCKGYPAPRWCTACGHRLVIS